MLQHVKTIFFISSFCRPSLQITIGSTTTAFSRLEINHFQNRLYTNRNKNNNDMMSDSTKNNAATANIRQQKQLLRKQIRSRVRSVYPSPSSSSTSDNNDIEKINAAKLKLTTQSNQVFHQLFQLPQYQSASTIGFFLSMPHGEIQTRDAIQRMVGQDGKTLYVPRVGLDFELCDMDLVRCDISSTTATTTFDASSSSSRLFYDNWPTNKWGIPEPPSSNTNIATPGDIDLLIVPGLAFDCNLHRLGQGKGYYDRFIAKMKNGETDADKKKLLLVGVCLDEQFLEEESIPVSDHDFIMDMVLTPSKKL